MPSSQQKRRKAQRDAHNENKDKILQERRSMATNTKARESYQSNSELKRADERRYRRDPEANWARKRARYRPSSLYFKLYLSTCISLL